MISKSPNPLPVVSVIITNFNYARFLTEAIESVLQQTYPAVELVIVDDGSTDNSQEIIEHYRHQAKIIFKANGGQASAFNAGLRLSRGEIIMFLDSDDYLMPNAVARVVSSWKPNLSRCHFRLKKVDQAGRHVGEEPPLSVALPAGDLAERQLDRYACHWVPTSGNAFHRSVLEKIFPVDERFKICADAWIFYRSAFGGEVFAIEELLGAYRVHGANYYAGEPCSDAQAVSILRSRVASIHAKVEAVLLAGNGAASPCSVAGRHLNLWAIRLLLIAKYLGITGPVFELENQFTKSRLHALLLDECLHNREPFMDRLRCLAGAIVLSVLPKSFRVRWDRSTIYEAKHYVRGLFRGGRPSGDKLNSKP